MGASKLIIRGGAALAMALALATLPASAKPADCFTTDDGNYPCNFTGTDRAGSFEITAPGYPTVIVNVEEAGVAWLFKTIEGRNVALPGPYYRADDDRACWANPDTGDRVCAW